jgi:UrcA family protein
MLKTVTAFAAVLVSSALVVPTVSHAETINSMRVSYADLNLASATGQVSLQRRINYAARTVCEIEDSRELALAHATNLCRGDAVAGAWPAYEAAVAAARQPSVEVIGAASIIVAAP